MSFEDCLPIVLKAEGTYSDNPSDSGGATMRGITQQTYDAARHSAGLPLEPVAAITDADVADIYRRMYWDVVHGDRLPGPVALVCFDAAVNCGAYRSVRWLQAVLGVAQDGLMGQVTEHALIGHEPLAVALDLIDRRIDYYRLLVALKPSNSVFLKGWLARCQHLRQVITQ